MHSRQGKSGRAVVPRCGCEAHCRVAIGAVSHRKGRPGSGVRRGVGPLPAAAIVCVQMAAGISAIGRGDRKRVIVIDVAKIAGHGCMAVGQGETGGAVIENARGPRCDWVAARAGRSRGRKTGRDVIRYRSAYRCGAEKNRLVASVTIRGIERIVVVHMAQRARGRRRGRMRSGQRKSGDAVIEGRSGPTGCGVASGAVGRGKRRAGSGVHGSSRLLPGGQMALRVAAIGRGNRQTVVVVDVAEGASHIRVSIGQQESGGAVVECRGRPTHRIVAGRAISNRKSRAGRRMDRIIGLLPVRQMALRVSAIGGSNRQTVIVVDVAKGASHIRMPIGKRKAGRGVVEYARSPRCDWVAGRTRRRGCRETGCDMVRYRTANRCGADKSRLVASVTIR